ncbi:glutathione S-transferase family protein [Oryzifoliimicrobium ureilyticus]|uniref:glutathione S-transferase family protein n=1 Tax=Oryzifoliimicrobium ureilyticus TaxID=3113724 RepID=UPI00307608F5
MTRTLYSLCGASRARLFSPHCWKVVMALAHKGLDFEEVALTFTEIPEVGKGASATVPFLKDGETIVSDSFAIARYLDEIYPDRPSLFKGEGGIALSRMVEGWSQTQLHPAIARIALLDIHDILDEQNKAYFRASREKSFGKPLESVVADRAAEEAAFPGRLQPLRHMLKFQNFIGGDTPLFADYIVFGALQWLRVTSSLEFMAKDDPVMIWFDRCLDLHDCRGRAVSLS